MTRRHTPDSERHLLSRENHMMKHIIHIILSLFLLLPLSAIAQSAGTEPGSIIERIEEESNGNIIIDIPDDILKDIFERPEQRTQAPGARRGSGKQERMTNQGFRIQIFGDGRNQATLRSRATARANAVCARFPKYRGQVYSFSKAPNWYTRIGNFKTRQEADAALGELKRAFPAFASEMRIVKSNIVPTR